MDACFHIERLFAQSVPGAVETSSQRIRGACPAH